jgi:predicted nucleic acid-binding protein
MLQSLEILPFTDAAAVVYGQIVARAGYSRRKVIDRMIAAQALVSSATVVTTNPSDYRDAPGLKLIAW